MAVFLREQLVEAHAVHRPAAVVPQDQRIPVRRAVLHRIVQKLRQRLRRAHAHVAELRQRAQALPVHPVDRHRVVGKAVLPQLRAPRAEHDIHPFRVHAGVQHLGDVAGRRAAQALQVAARHVHHQRQLSCLLRKGRHAPHHHRQRQQQRQGAPLLVHRVLPEAVSWQNYTTTRLRLSTGRGPASVTISLNLDKNRQPGLLFHICYKSIETYYGSMYNPVDKV